MHRVLRTVLFSGVLSGLLCSIVVAAQAPATPDQVFETADEAFTRAVRGAIGAPARGDLGDQATIRLGEDLLLIPKELAARLLMASQQDVPPDFIGLLIGPDGMSSMGIIRFVQAGFIDADSAASWTADDFLASLRDTVELDNPLLVAKKLQPREARRWVQPPHYNRETHQLTWAALIIPKDSPRESDGEITYNAIGFGREGYIQLSIVTSVQQADAIAHMANVFLNGLVFRPGKRYEDVTSVNRRAPAGLAGAMGIQSLHKAPDTSSFWSSDKVMPAAGGLVAAIGGISLFLYVQRYLRREARRG